MLLRIFDSKFESFYDFQKPAGKKMSVPQADPILTAIESPIYFPRAELSIFLTQGNPNNNKMSELLCP